MTSTRHLLVVERTGESLAKKSASVTPATDPVLTHVVKTISDAVPELEPSGYDAVFIRVNGPEELSLVLRIKTVGWRGTAARTWCSRSRTIPGRP